MKVRLANPSDAAAIARVHVYGFENLHAAFPQAQHAAKADEKGGRGGQ